MRIEILQDTQSVRIDPNDWYAWICRSTHQVQRQCAGWGECSWRYWRPADHLNCRQGNRCCPMDKRPHRAMGCTVRPHGMSWRGPGEGLGMEKLVSSSSAAKRRKWTVASIQHIAQRTTPKVFKRAFHIMLVRASPLARPVHLSPLLCIRIHTLLFLFTTPAHG